MNSIIPLLINTIPLICFLLLFEGKKLTKWAGHIGVFITSITFILSVIGLLTIWQKGELYFRFNWLEIQGNKIEFVYRLNTISALMSVLVTFVSTLVQLYSMEYMKGDRHFYKYFAYIGLFTFSMLGIVLSNNLLQIFIYWELVGLSSYLLIGFWYQRPLATKASKKAFVINRIGDIGFLSAILILWNQFHTLDINEIARLMVNSEIKDTLWQVYLHSNGQIVLHTIPSYWLTIMGLGLFMGCVGKSAQFPLQVWLPDAMQGPTPASALIHAATMVAAGVYLLVITFPFLNETTLLVITIIGVITAFIGSFSAISQYDIKKILAYSTISQLGYMVMAIGAQAYTASIFHLFTHALFKAGLFLSVGAVIHALEHLKHQLPHNTDPCFDPQSVRIMGGLRNYMPKVFWAYILATGSAVGLPLFAGFLSKDMILSGVWAWANTNSNLSGHNWYFIIPIIAFASSFMTVYYMSRQLFMVFFGEFRLLKYCPEYKPFVSHLHDPGYKMLIPILVLGFLSLGIFFSFNPLDGAESWLVNALNIPDNLTPDMLLTKGELRYLIVSTEHHYHIPTIVITAVLSVFAFVLTYVRYVKKVHLFQISTKNTLYIFNKISTNAFFIDRLNEKYLIPAVIRFSILCTKFDSKGIDKIVNSSAVITVVFSHVIHKFDTLVVDGFVNFIAWLAQFFGFKINKYEINSVQVWLYSTMILILFVLIYLI